MYALRISFHIFISPFSILRGCQPLLFVCCLSSFFYVYIFVLSSSFLLFCYFFFFSLVFMQFDISQLGVTFSFSLARSRRPCVFYLFFSPRSLRNSRENMFLRINSHSRNCCVRDTISNNK